MRINIKCVLYLIEGKDIWILLLMNKLELNMLLKMTSLRSTTKNST